MVAGRKVVALVASPEGLLHRSTPLQGFPLAACARALACAALVFSRPSLPLVDGDIVAAAGDRERRGRRST